MKAAFCMQNEAGLCDGSCLRHGTAFLCPVIRPFPTLGSAHPALSCHRRSCMRKGREAGGRPRDALQFGALLKPGNPSMKAYR